jgi:hypothetical protein
MRFIEAHKINPANDKLHIAVLDEPGSGGANHVYRIGGYDIDTNAMDADLRLQVQESKQVFETHLVFQNGPIGEVGVNGLTHEVLLAILVDRLTSFQVGPYACDENAQALRHLRDAQAALLARTQKRTDRSVEGTHTV